MATSLRIEIKDNGTSVLIPQGASLPGSMSDIFSTAVDNQTSVDIHLLEGDAEAANLNRHLGRFQLLNITPQPRAVPQIEFIVSVSEEGELTIEVEELGTENRRVYKDLRVPVVR